MKEILYIQAGQLANYVGTHFWNTQESYFTYGDDEDQAEPLVTNDISFRESLAYKDEPLICPRLLVFDRKANFGTLSKNLLGRSRDDSDQNSTNGNDLWSGNTVEYRQDPIQKSRYHDKIDNEGDADAVDEPLDEPEVRYWSDFNRLYYIPRTVQKLPDAAEWEDREGDWEGGKDLFREFDEETGLMEDPLRAFLEECDALQGLQLTYDTAGFGSFTSSFLTSFRDEFSKLSILSFPLLSDAIRNPLDVDDHGGRRKALNDALCLRSLHDLVSMSVPIQSPLTWPKQLEGVNLNPDDIYHTSALLSAHIESCTLPLRLRGTREDLTSFTSHLNWRGSTRFAELAGLASDSSIVDFDKKLLNLSSLDTAKENSDSRAHSEFTRRDVTRGFSLPAITVYYKWQTDFYLREPFFLHTHAPLYPLPTSFPNIFGPSGPQNRSRAVPLYTSLSTTPRTSNLFRQYASFVEANINDGIVNGLDRDDMKELVNDLWSICDGYDDGSGNAADIEGSGDAGEDEE